MIRIKLFLYISIFIFFLQSCNKEFGEVKQDSDNPVSYEQGIWVLNEGLFGQGNGEISFIQNNKVYNNLYNNANKIPMGDIPADILVEENRLIVTVNNSSKIYFLSKENLSVIYAINVFSPRKIIKIKENEYLVSSFNNDKIYHIDATSTPIVTEINSKKSTEAMILHGNYVFITNWSNYNSSYSNNTVEVFDINTKQIIDSIVVGKEPNSITEDKDGKIWVLCSGGYNSEENPSLVQFDPETRNIIKTFIFDNKDSSPFSLIINQTRDTLYFINNDIYKMCINDSTLPLNSFIIAGTKTFYTIAGNVKDNIFISDVKNYQEEGDILQYDLSGTFKKKYNVGINPSDIIEN